MNAVESGPTSPIGIPVAPPPRCFPEMAVFLVPTSCRATTRPTSMFNARSG